MGQHEHRHAGLCSEKNSSSKGGVLAGCKGPQQAMRGCGTGRREGDSVCAGVARYVVRAGGVACCMRPRRQVFSRTHTSSHSAGHTHAGRNTPTAPAPNGQQGKNFPPLTRGGEGEGGSRQREEGERERCVGVIFI